MTLLICLFGLGIFLYYFAYFYESDDISRELQGYAMIIRVPPQIYPYDQIFISPTGRVVRQLFLPPPGSVGAGIDLNPAELKTIETLRSQWCATIPAAHEEVIAPSAYNIGINCGGFPNDKRITLNYADVPKSLMAIIMHQPTLPTRQ